MPTVEFLGMGMQRDFGRSSLPRVPGQVALSRYYCSALISLDQIAHHERLLKDWPGMMGLIGNCTETPRF
jgi:hypothetical protein